MNHISPLTKSCPTAEEIHIYAAGGYCEDQATDLEVHLLACAQCETLLDSFDDPSDAVIQALVTLPMSPDDEAGYQALRKAVLAKPVEFANSAEATAHLQCVSRLADPALGPLPCRLGSYELLACIGRGASGAVYRARHLKLDQMVAIKVLDASRSFATDSFLQEMKTIGSLVHEHIVRATDAGEADGLHFLVMEYVEGIDAARLLFRHGPLCVADACEITRQTALGLKFVHEQSLVHRDIKPSNLLVTVEGQVKLLDLGIATRSDTQVPTDRELAKPQGTYDYMAPEQWSNAATVDHRTDLYSLGCTLFKLLTGSVPPKPHATVSKFRTDVPRSVERLLQRLLSSEAQDRPDSTDEVIRSLRQFALGANLATLVTRVTPTQTRDANAKKPKLSWSASKSISRRTAAAALVAAAASILLFSRMRFGTTPHLRRTEWRALAPVAPELLLTLDDPEQVQLDTSEQGEIHVSSKDLTLVHLGRPVTGLFTLSVQLQQTDWQGSGVFFQGKTEYTDDSRTLRFQTVELKATTETTTRRLLWSQWTSIRANERTTMDQTPLAEVPVEISANPVGQHLQITCGRQGMPEIVWNDEKLHESRWQFSLEARNFQRLSAAKIPTAYLGRLGVINTSGSTTFIQPRLVYL